MKRALVLLTLFFLFSSCAHFNRSEPADTVVDTAVAPTTSSAEIDPDPERLRVVSFNVHMQSADAIVRAFRESTELRRADVVFFQEIESHTREPASRAALVAEELGMHVAYAPGYGLQSGGSHGVAILSRYALEDITLIELPRYEVVFNSARRVALGASIGVGGESIRIYAVHLDNRLNSTDRRKQMAPVLEEALAQPVERIIVGGDLNTSPFCWLGHVVPVPCGGRQKERLETAARASGFATPVKHSGPTHKWLSMKLDGIYTRALAVVDYGVERDVRISDHLPLWADFEIN